MDDPELDAIPVPEEWSPERAEAVIAFLEAIAEALHRRYDLSIIAMSNDRRNPSYGPPVPAGRRDEELPF